jgi:hypothetical protein
MFTHGTTSGSLLFNCIRLSPIASPLILGALQYEPDIQRSQAAVGRLLVLAAIVLVWSMAESALMLWHRAKLSRSGPSGGYGFVTLLLGVVLLGLLSIFRARSSQSLFLLTLAMLSVRGMSRAGWEQGRSQVAFGGAVVGGILLTLLSLLALSPDLNWQRCVFSIALGCAVASVEVAWFGLTVSPHGQPRWVLPVYRIVLFAGPVIVATMALAGQLPIQYSAVYLLVPLAARITSRLSRGDTHLSSCYRAAAGVYLGFVGIMLACLGYLNAR